VFEKMASDQTIFRCIDAHAKQSPKTIAFVAPERLPLTYSGLQLLIESVVQFLNRIGIGRNDPVAVVLPNGPELATAFLAVASAATCAPLNPSYETDEFDFYLSDLKAKALLVQSGLDVAARTVALARNIPIIELVPALDAEAGLFELSSDDTGSHKLAGFIRSNDVAMALHTSGTTSRPKLVPLTQANLCLSAENIRRTLALDSGDRCLNVMPLFHVHGLIGAVLASMMAGASVICSPGFNPDRFSGGWDRFSQRGTPPYLPCTRQ
jgi:acyl-CoA synthetase (AMP-forming)/AMP-acid ligase II